MASGYSKLFSDIVTSSIWCEDNDVLRVWVAMLATCDKNGIVSGSIPGFASLCRMTNGEMETVIAKLMSPDPYSRTKTREGRRIEEVAGGWSIINYPDYRNKGQSQEGSRAPYMKARRAANCNALHSVTPECNNVQRVMTPASVYASASEEKRNRISKQESRGWDVPELPEEAL